MAIAGVIIENPALEQVGLPIQVTEYDFQREINAAGSWACSFPASQTLANQVRSRWRVSIIEEGRPGYLLRRGVVVNRNYSVAEDGTGVLALTGYSRLFAIAAESTHLGLDYDGTVSMQDIANDLTGETVTAPPSADIRKPKVTFNDTSKLAALLNMCELTRFNIRETWENDGFELVEQDDVPDSGFRFVTVEHAGPELENAAANGMGLIASTPSIGYAGGDLATRIIPVGTEHDGTPLTLGSADRSDPYPIQTGTNPDGSNYYYLEDEDAVALSGVVEQQYVRSDVKNPSDNAATRLAAANVLYAYAYGELLKRRYDVISFASEIANGRRIDALPGDRVRVQFRGRARTPTGTLTWQDIDTNFLIVKRRDASGPAGVRGVSFTLTAPEIAMEIPDLPDAVPIPPPPTDPPSPPDPTPDDPSDDPSDDPGDDTGPDDTPPFEDPGLPTMEPGLPSIADLANPNPDKPGGYQPCCAGGTEITDYTNCGGNYHFTWEPGVDGEDEPTYVVQVSSNPAFSGVTIDTPAAGSPVNIDFVADLGLPSGTYYVRVKSTFADMSTTYSATITVRF